ncbi:putative ABC transport system permease protein [Catenuloplanes nepalensis]|uniref:ABC transport system permease protein n=1 Tax=Catenuloplanes nepalensis TaxID=587533 RepID=A0ABT9MN09_9ACTN|nr:ABC transporter permease [Catenuloplanes nepalensis]MDP9792775.1 putative ABC transport system permease protein [Catenuloplanes nepalensis]
MMRLAGRNRSALIIGLQGIRARKLRTLLSMVSLFLGILAVVAVQAGASIAERALLSDIELTSGYDGTRIADLYGGPAGTVDTVADTVAGRTDAVALVQAQATIGESGVSPIQPGPSGTYEDAKTEGPADFCNQTTPNQVCPPIGRAISVQLNALTGDVRTFRPYQHVSGEWLTFDTVPSLSPRIVLNKEAALGFSRYPVPAALRIEGGTGGSVTPQFIGVIDDGMGWPQAYVRMDELTEWTSTDTAGIQVLLAGQTPVEQVLSSKLRAKGMEFAPYEVQSRKDFQEQIGLMRLLFLGLSAFVLLIGVAGVLNVGLATVGERVEEFALRRAVGTPRSLLAGIVLAETLLTGLLTAAAAIGFAAGALKVATSVMGSSDPFFAGLTFPWEAAVAGIIAGIVAGVLGGFIPALRAARIPIATVMRA